MRIHFQCPAAEGKKMKAGIESRYITHTHTQQPPKNYGRQSPTVLMNALIFFFCKRYSFVFENFVK